MENKVSSLCAVNHVGSCKHKLQYDVMSEILIFWRTRPMSGYSWTESSILCYKNWNLVCQNMRVDKKSIDMASQFMSKLFHRLLIALVYYSFSFTLTFVNCKFLKQFPTLYEYICTFLTICKVAVAKMENKQKCSNFSYLRRFCGK